VLAFAEGAAPEVVADRVTGRLCRDDADMVDALAGIDSIDRAACRADVEARFSTARMAREHIELFERVLSRR
jgi:glycosyltransferase involved in cell wall biosynthesis